MRRKQKTGYENILKMLKTHKLSCSTRKLGASDYGKCTCGRDKAVDELASLVTVWETHWEILREKIMEEK